MQKVLTGAPVDLPALIAKTKPATANFQSVGGEHIPAIVQLDNNTSDNRTIIDLQAEDRVGLLYDISRALAELNINLLLAKILTEKGAAIDTFYVTERLGAKLLAPERQEAIKKRLYKAAQLASPAGK
jgi:[protein-PII] uridylyltransferase